MLVASCGTLEGLAAEPGCLDGVSIPDLEAGTELKVRTRHSTYHLRVIDPENRYVVLEGGKLFPDEIEARICGSTAGGTAIKTGWIGVGLRMEIRENGRRATTSPVESIEIERPH